jgi:hypothetical protein
MMAQINDDRDKPEESKSMLNQKSLEQFSAIEMSNSNPYEVGFTQSQSNVD